MALSDDRDEESLRSLIVWAAPESGSYDVEVTSFDGVGVGSYTLPVTAESRDRAPCGLPPRRLDE